MMAFQPKYKPASHNSRYHRELVNFLKEQNYTHVLTLHWGKDRCIKYDRLRRDLKSLHARVDRHLLGTRYNKKPNRTEAIFFVEGEDNLNLHAHSFWKVPRKHHDRFESLFMPPLLTPTLWREIAPIGTCDLQWNDNPDAAAKYLTKQAHYDSDDQRLIFSSARDIAQNHRRLNTYSSLTPLHRVA